MAFSSCSRPLSRKAARSETSYLRGRRSLTRNRVERRAPEYEKLCLDLRRHGRALGHLDHWLLWNIPASVHELRRGSNRNAWARVGPTISASPATAASAAQGPWTPPLLLQIVRAGHRKAGPDAGAKRATSIRRSGAMCWRRPCIWAATSESGGGEGRLAGGFAPRAGLDVGRERIRLARSCNLELDGQGVFTGAPVGQPEARTGDEGSLTNCTVLDRRRLPRCS